MPYKNRAMQTIAARRWAERNRGLIHERYRSRYRPGARETIVEWREKVALFGGYCAYCGRDDRPLTRDHRIPLIRGGTDYIDNVVPACRPCNSAKQSRTDVEFIAQRKVA